MTSNWVKVDIKQAQLNIVTKIWDLPKIREDLIEVEGGTWRHLAKICGLPLDREAKAALKVGIYSLLYGRTKSRLKQEMGKSLGAIAADRFLKSAPIQRLITKRDDLLCGVEGGDIRNDAFGAKMSVNSWPKEGSAKDKTRSVLACEAQSYELPLLLPVIEYAKGTEMSESPLYVTAWLHDGLWLDCADKSRMPGHLKQIRELIGSASESLLGFKVGVDVEDPNDQLLLAA